MNCPAPDDVVALVFGTLPDGRLAAVSQHVDSCDTCRSTAERLESETDALLAELRRASPGDPYVDEAGWSTAVRMAEGLIEGDTESNATEATRIVGAAGARDRQPDGTVPEIDLGQYRLLRKLGEGGMGAVYEAVHLPLDKLVAIKVLPPNRTRDQQAVSRFQRETRAAGRLAHPNIVAALDGGTLNDTQYLVMELVAGEDLGTIGHRLGKLRVSDACELVRQAATGLQHAHDNGLVHRDIKPSNLMLSRDGAPDTRLKILDMGLALLNEQHAEPDGLTGTGQVMGTIDYMAPEQANDTHGVDGRADVYSLGATLYRLLGGRAPLAGEESGILNRLSALATRDPDPINSLRPEVPQPLADLIHRMLAKSPVERPPTPGAVAEALTVFTTEAALEDLLEISRDEYEERRSVEQVLYPPTPETVRSRKSKWPWFAAVVSACSLLFLALPDVRTFLFPADRDARVPVPELPGPGPATPQERALPVEPATDYALRFDGVDDYVELPPLNVPPDSPLTLECRVTMARLYPGRVYSTNGMAFIAGWMNLQGIKLVAYDTGPGAKSMRDYDPERKTFPYTYIKSPLSTVGRTVHMAAVHDGQEFAFYIDGELIDSKSYPLYRKPFDGPFLGGYVDRTDKTDHHFVRDMAFDGAIDEIRISSIARSPSGPGKQPDRFETDPHTLALYHCDDVHNERLLDSSGNGRHGTIYGPRRVVVTDGMAARIEAEGNEQLERFAETNPWIAFTIPETPRPESHGEFLCHWFDGSESSPEKWSVSPSGDLLRASGTTLTPVRRLAYNTSIYNWHDEGHLYVMPYNEDLLAVQATTDGQSSNLGLAWSLDKKQAGCLTADRTLNLESSSVLSVATSMDGALVAVVTLAAPNELLIYNTLADAEPRRLSAPTEESLRYGLEFIQGDTHIAAGTDTGSILIYDLASGDISSRLPGSGEVRCMNLSHDGRWLAVGYEDDVGAFEVWDIERRERRWRVDERGVVRAVCFSPDGQTLAVAADDALILCDADTGRIRGRLGRLRELRTIEFRPDGELLVVPKPAIKANPYSALYGLDVNAPEKPPREIVRLRYRPSMGIAAHPSEPLIAISLWHTILFVDAESSDSIKAGWIPRAAYWSSTFSRDGSVFVGSNYKPGAVTIWKTATIFEGKLESRARLDSVGAESGRFQNPQD